MYMAEMECSCGSRTPGVSVGDGEVLSQSPPRDFPSWITEMLCKGRSCSFCSTQVSVPDPCSVPLILFPFTPEHSVWSPLSSASACGVESWIGLGRKGP